MQNKVNNHCSQSLEGEAELPLPNLWQTSESGNTVKNLESPSLVFYVADSELEERSPTKGPSWELRMDERREVGRLQVMSDIRPEREQSGGCSRPRPPLQRLQIREVTGKMQGLRSVGNVGSLCSLQFCLTVK